MLVYAVDYTIMVISNVEYLLHSSSDDKSETPVSLSHLLSLSLST